MTSLPLRSGSSEFVYHYSVFSMCCPLLHVISFFSLADNSVLSVTQRTLCTPCLWSVTLPIYLTPLSLQVGSSDAIHLPSLTTMQFERSFSITSIIESIFYQLLSKASFINTSILHIKYMILIYTYSLFWLTRYSSLMQFQNMGSYGTKVVVYNLWFNDEGITELDFDTDPEVVFLFYWLSFQPCVEISFLMDIFILICRIFALLGMSRRSLLNLHGGESKRNILQKHSVTHYVYA